MAWTFQPSRPPRHCTTTRFAASRTSGSGRPRPSCRRCRREPRPWRARSSSTSRGRRSSWARSSPASTGRSASRRSARRAASRARPSPRRRDPAATLDRSRLEREVAEVRKRPAGAVAADAVATDLRLDGDVLLHLRVPVVGPLGADEERDHAHARLGARVVEVLARVDDLLELAVEGDLVALEERENVVLLISLAGRSASRRCRAS